MIKAHQIQIDFNVTETIKRFVYVYLIEAENCYLIDSGVYGCESQIIEYMESIGRKASEIKGIFLTHAHPDHIGSAAWFREHTGCKVYASKGESRWIENIDLQFRERPIPNFYALAGRSVHVDQVVKNGNIIEPEPDLRIEVLRTAGHSTDGMSYLIGSNLFIGDAVPIKGDIPIFIDEDETQKTLELLGQMSDVEMFYPAWDQSYTPEDMKTKIKEAGELLNILKHAVMTCEDGSDNAELIKRVCEYLHMPFLMGNPLFLRTVSCLRKGEK